MAHEQLLIEMKKEVLFEMLLHFKNKQDQLNRSLQESGDSKYMTPFESIYVQDIKDYATYILSDDSKWLDI